MTCRKYNYTLGKKAIRRMRQGKLGVYPLVDFQGVPAVYFLHKKIRKIQILADKILDCPRNFIRRKGKYFYIKATGRYVQRWVDYVKGNEKWKRTW